MPRRLHFFIVYDMKYFLYFFCLFLVIFCILSVIYKNPYRLIYLFGKKGSGKSTYMVIQMIKYLRKGWDVYTDMPDVNIFGVKLINAKDLEHFTPSVNSALFLDELGLTFDNRKFKSFPDGINQWFKFQRKYKVVCYCNSQNLDIDLKLRILLDKMYLCQSIGGLFTLIRPITRTITLTQPSAEAESRVADLLKFDKIWHWKLVYLPRYFKYFNSFSAPQRDIIPYKIISDGIQVCKGRNAHKLLKEIKEDPIF